MDKIIEETEELKIKLDNLIKIYEKSLNQTIKQEQRTINLSSISYEEKLPQIKDKPSAVELDIWRTISLCNCEAECWRTIINSLNQVKLQIDISIDKYTKDANEIEKIVEAETNKRIRLE